MTIPFHDRLKFVLRSIVLQHEGSARRRASVQIHIPGLFLQPSPTPCNHTLFRPVCAFPSGMAADERRFSGFIITDLPMGFPLLFLQPLFLFPFDRRHEFRGTNCYTVRTPGTVADVVGFDPVMSANCEPRHLRPHRVNI